MWRDRYFGFVDKTIRIIPTRVGRFGRIAHVIQELHKLIGKICNPAAAQQGMHPTADTTVVKFNQRLGRAGDAGRRAAT